MNDYKIHVFEIAWLPDETIAQFQSDFRFVADYYNQIRKNKKWQPMSGKVKHVKELFELFGSLTSDTRFVEMYHQRKGEQNDMASIALDYLAAEYIAQGEARGEIRGKDIATLNSIRNLMKTSSWNAQQAMDALLIPSADQKRYAAQLQS